MPKLRVLDIVQRMEESHGYLPSWLADHFHDLREDAGCVKDTLKTYRIRHWNRNRPHASLPYFDKHCVYGVSMPYLEELEVELNIPDLLLEDDDFVSSPVTVCIDETVNCDQIVILFLVE